MSEYNGTITTGNTSQQAAANKQDRSQLVFQNLSDTDMFLRFGAAATVGQGTRVAAQQDVILHAARLPQIRSKVFVASAVAGGAYLVTDDSVDM